MRRSINTNLQQVRLLLIGFVYCNATYAVMAQNPLAPAAESPSATSDDEQESPEAPTKVDVKPVARDEEIRQRLQRVLEATDWFHGSKVQVEEGVVMLFGTTDTSDLKKWAGELARNTQDVVAVVNRIEVTEPSVWDFGPAWTGLWVLWRDFIRALPLFAFGLLILALSFGAAVLASRATQAILRRRIEAKLLRNVIASGTGTLAFLLGVYIVLRVAGLTQLALTVVGGTGLLGLILGIAFRDITENFLASVFLSMQQPFATGDLVEVNGVTGFVQQLNVRTTVLMNLDGNIVQIPNATVFKSNIRNYTTNSNRREVFSIGIGYDDSINDAQEVARNVLTEHPAVLTDPEPAVLVSNLGKATVNLEIYFWLNGHEHSANKVRSSVIRLIKVAFQENGISMPDEAREVVFPQGIPVTMLEGRSPPREATKPRQETSSALQANGRKAVSTTAEAGLYSDAVVIEDQARKVQPLKAGENLLKPDSEK